MAASYIKVQQPSLNFEKICRACLQVKKDMRPLFEQLTATMLMIVSKVEVAVGDGLPSQLCLQCVHQISRCHAFKEMVEKNDVTLREHAKVRAEEALKNQEKQATLAMDQSYIQYMELPINGAPGQLLEGFFVPEQQTVQPSEDDAKGNDEFDPLVPDKPSEQVVPSTSKSDEAINSDEENYLQLVVYQQATSTVSPGRHMCNLCHKEFKHSRWLKQHMKLHTNWIKANCKKPPMCHICDRTFKGPGMLKMHMRTHEQRPPKQPTCSVCQRTFTTKTLLYRHRQTHFEPKTHQCTVCEKRFYSAYALRSHMARHRGERPYVCTMCAKSFYNPTDLKVHFRLHTGEKPLKCSECSKTFRRHSTLCQHMKKHKGIRNHVCNVCFKGFYEVSKLNAHMRIHTGERPFECQYCDRKFAQQSALIYHRRTHTGEKPYTCKVCPARFTTCSARNNHILTHTGNNKRFGCGICMKTFPTRTELRVHAAKHSDGQKVSLKRVERKHQCNVCGKGFADTNAYKRHMKTHDVKSDEGEGSNDDGDSAADSETIPERGQDEDNVEIEVMARVSKPKDNKIQLSQVQLGQSHAQVIQVQVPQVLRQSSPVLPPSPPAPPPPPPPVPQEPPQKRYKCGVCVKAYMQLHRLKKHMLTQHLQNQVPQQQIQPQQQQTPAQQLQHQVQQVQVQQVQQQMQQQVLQVGGVPVPIHQQMGQGMVQGGQYPVISSVHSLQLQQSQHNQQQPQGLQVQTIQIHPQHQPIQIHAVGMQQVQQQQLHVATSSCQTMLPNILQLQPTTVDMNGVAHRIILQPQQPQVYTIHHS